ncbi:MAG: hypothetical protein ABIR63_03240 [Sphingomicrobium sp.]
MTPRHDEDDSFTDSARRQAIEAYDQARDTVSDAGQKARDSLGEAPLIALVGGIAAGALIAALLPRTDRETELVAPTAKRIKKTARAAADAARETGSSHLSDLGISRGKGEQSLRSLLQNVGDAAKASADAALSAARKN